MRPRLCILACVIAAALAAAPAALADGDPASDVLTVDNVFFPYQPKVSTRLREQLTALAEGVRAQGVPVKLALIASKLDLGVQTKRFNHPASYAELLGLELEVAGAHDLTVAVMPAGTGVYRYGDKHLGPLRAAIAGVRPAAARDSDELARAGGRALIAIARAAGHPAPAALAAPFDVTSSAGSSSGGAGALLWVVLGVVVVAAAGFALRLRYRAASPTTGGNA